MIYKIENDLLEILLNSEGAELTSIKGKNDNLEYLWIGDKNYWGRHAPVLFPIVGKVNNNTYRLNDEIYHLNQHGLARDCNFEILSTGENFIKFSLKYSEETLKIYPYKFNLKIKYTLIDSKIQIDYEVINLDKDEIYFSIGAHPGFNCPLLPNESFDDYYIQFEKNETCPTMVLNKEGFLKREKISYLKDSNIINLNDNTFKNDALIFKNLISNRISLKSNKSSKSISLDFKGFPFLGIWSMPTGAPFICMEPWFGHADFEDFDDDFKNKPGIIKLNVNNSFKCNYKIEINQ
ncbi:MAG: aldose 1-epimerase family protein [Clostridiaceae bacterium]